MTTESKK